MPAHSVPPLKAPTGRVHEASAQASAQAPAEGVEPLGLPMLSREADASPERANASATARHPRYRLAFTVPWIGKAFPSWFPYFVASAARSAYIADWLIFHEGTVLETSVFIPPNVLLHDLGRGGLGRLFGSKLARAIGPSASEATLVQLFQQAFRDFAYIVTEYKPTHGTVFADFLAHGGYTHWSYTDLDMVMGDLPVFIEREELQDFHLVSYHFGDVFRLYLRGQFTAHQNTPHVNALWTKCSHLSNGLQAELESKHKIVRALAKQGKRGRTRFISAEGCYSAAVASEPGLRVKYAAKAFADWSEDKFFYVADGAVRKCIRPEQAWLPGANGSGACEPFGPRLDLPSAKLTGVQTPIGEELPLRIHHNCSRWVQKSFRLCASLSEKEAPLYNVFLRDGRWTAQRFVSRAPAGSLEGAFLHLQQWKGRYRKLRYGGASIPLLQGRTTFLLSPRGFLPVDMTYDDTWGGVMATGSEVLFDADRRAYYRPETKGTGEQVPARTG
mgnify:CR=1 FL=1